MQLCLTLEHRFMQTPDGKIWTVTQCPYEFFAPYLEVFDSVRVIARAFPVARMQADFVPVTGPGVEFYAMPAYRGPWELIKNFFAVRKLARNAVPKDSAVVLRVPGQLANTIERTLRSQSHSYSVDVVADPYDVFSPESNSSLIAPIARRLLTRAMQKQCLRADAVCYVTQEYLQQRYPSDAKPNHASAGRYALGVSDIFLDAACFAAEPRRAKHEASALRVIYIGTIESLYKGPDLLIRSLAICKDAGVFASARIIGIGKMKDTLEQLSRDLGVSDRVTFVGAVQSGQAIREELAASDVFVLPSRAEGVPRAMLEAMAQGIPCLGSRIGGIPELLDAEDMTLPNDADSIAHNLMDLARSEERFARSASRSFHRADDYAATKLIPQRREFYSVVRQMAQERLGASARSRHDELPVY